MGGTLRTSKTLIMAKEAAQDAVTASTKAIELTNEAMRLILLAKESAELSAAKSSETVTLIAANKAISKRLRHDDQEWWASAAGIDKWLVQEMYQEVNHLNKEIGHKYWFVDVGANDGVSRSQSYALESRFQWKGICIEANDISFKALSLGRPNCINVQACVAKEGGLVESFAVDHSILVNETTGEIYSGMYSGILETNIGDGWESKDAPIQTCRTKTLDQILSEASAPSFIEFLSIDCEGCELGVLSSFPFNQYRFGILILEHNGDGYQRSKIRSILELNGYIRLWADYPDDTYILAPHLWPEKGYSKGVAIASGVTPYLNLEARQFLLQNIADRGSSKTVDEDKDRFENMKAGVNGWMCPVPLIDVLFDGAVSGTCPIPSAHNGYKRLDITTLPRTISTLNYDDVYNNGQYNNGQETKKIYEDSYDIKGGIESFLKDQMGVAEPMMEILFNFIRARVTEDLENALSGHGPSNTMRSHLESGAAYLRTSISSVPGIIASIDPLFSDSRITVPDFVMFDYNHSESHTSMDVDGKDTISTNNEKIHFNSKERMSDVCNYFGNIDQVQCDQISTVLSNYSTPVYLQGLKQQPSSIESLFKTSKTASINTHDDKNDGEMNIAAGYFKPVHLQLYADACLMIENNNNWTPLLDPEIGCVSLAWRLDLDTPIDFSLNDKVTSVLLEPVMKEFPRCELSESSQLLLKYAASWLLS